MTKYSQRVLLPLTTEQKTSIASKPQGMSAYIRAAIDEKLARDTAIANTALSELVMQVAEAMTGTA